MAGVCEWEYMGRTTRVVLRQLLKSLLMTDEKVLCEISKFAKDKKIASQVNTLDIRSMQRT